MVDVIEIMLEFLIRLDGISVKRCCIACDTGPDGQALLLSII